MEDSTSSMVKLTATHSIWRSMMEDLLYCKDLYDPVEEKMEDKDWKVLNRKTVMKIRQWVDHSVFHHVSLESNAYSLWKKLKSLYERKTAQDKAFTIRKLLNLKYNEGCSVAKHLSDFQDLVNQLAMMKITFADEVQALLLLSFLLDSQETLMVSLSNSASNGVLTYKMVNNSVFNEESRRKEVGANSSQALATENRGRSKHRSQSSRGRSKSKF